MTRKQSIIVFLSILLGSLACADTIVHYIPGPPGMLGGGTTGKKAGDVISLLTDQDIATSCDFNKQIVVTRTSILCIYNGKS